MVCRYCTIAQHIRQGPMSKANTKHHLHVILTRQQYEGLARQAKERGESIGVLIRELVSASLDKAGKGAK